MALRRSAFTALTCAMLALGACTPAPDVPTQRGTDLTFRDGPPKADLATIAVLTPFEAETQDLWKALVLELGDDFNIVTIPVSRSTAADDLSRELLRVEPECVVVVDNRTMQLYRNLQEMRPNQAFPPAVVVMTSFLDRTIGSLRSATGIAYEIPAVSGIVTLREVTEQKVERVGVLHRKSFADVVQAQTRLATVEKAVLVPMAVSDNPTPEEIEDSLDKLIVKEKVDALWVLNDNRLLTADLLASSWLPVLRFRPVPVVVGVSALVHPSVHFGTLAVYPQHAKLGVQAANLVFDLADNDWELTKDDSVELPLSLTTVVDVGQVDDLFGLRPDALTKIDKAVE